jgi:hypothetical protein
MGDSGWRCHCVVIGVVMVGSLSIMPNEVELHDDIGSFVAVFVWFVANESDNFLLLLLFLKNEAYYGLC